MTHKTTLRTTTALTMAVAIFASGLFPISQASAHDSHHASKHGFNHSNWNKRSHRKFHKGYGRGDHGVHAYHKKRQQQRHHAKRKKSNKNGIIAAGVIGLALGAIIASESSKKKHSSYGSVSQPSYKYDGNGQSYTQQRIPLDSYGTPISQAPSTRGEPEVITFRDNASLEPWTPGWREWCSNRYRSFNAQTGTFRGFDGFDHFCVPK